MNEKISLFNKYLSLIYWKEDKASIKGLLQMTFTPFLSEKGNSIRTSYILSSITIKNKNFNFFLQKGYQKAKTCPLSIERKIKLVRTKAIKCSLSLWTMKSKILGGIKNEWNNTLCIKC